MKRFLTKVISLLVFAALLGTTALADVAYPGFSTDGSVPLWLPVILGILLAAIVVIVLVLVIHKRRR